MAYKNALSAPEICHQILMKIASIFNDSDMVNLEVVNWLASVPEALALALDSIPNPEWLRHLLSTSSEEQLKAAETKIPWSSFRYLLLLESFELEQFQAKVPAYLNAAWFLHLMKLGRHCHFEAFKYLITRGNKDLLNPFYFKGNLLLLLIECPVEEYWHLFMKHSNLMSFPYRILLSFGTAIELSHASYP